MSDSLDWLRWMNRERQRVGKVARYRRAHDVQPFRLHELARRKSSDTLIVLGSGRSITTLSERDWDTIRDHDTMGLNFWLLHDFVPSFYMFEVGPTPDRTRHFEQFLSERADRYLGVPMIYKDTDRHSLNLDALPTHIVSQLRVLNKINLPLDSEYRMRTALRWCLRLSVPKLTGLQIFGRASIVQALALGAVLGYRKIVLAGVDLNNPRYFWDEDPALSWFGKQPGQVHKTMLADKFVPVDQVIAAFNEVWLQPAGIELFCGHATSALHPDLPAYFR